MSDMAKLEQAIERLTKRVLVGNALKRVQLMGPERILDFVHRGDLLRLHIPMAHHDYVQRHIVTRDTFYELKQLETLREMKLINDKSVVLDVGGNIGNHAVYFAKVLNAKKVISFEPQNFAYSVLKKNMELNGMDPKFAIQAMVGTTKGYGEMSAFKSGNTGATQFEINDDGDVPMVSLDEFLTKTDFAKVDFVKIDVEGMHMEVLKGATKLLSDRKPHLWVELMADDVEEGHAFLAQYGYTSTKIANVDYIFSPS